MPVMISLTSRQPVKFRLSWYGRNMQHYYRGKMSL